MKLSENALSHNFLADIDGSRVSCFNKTLYFGDHDLKNLTFLEISYKKFLQK